MTKKKSISNSFQENMEIENFIKDAQSRLPFATNRDIIIRYKEYLEGLGNAEANRQFQEFYINFKLLYSQRYSIDNINAQLQSTDDINAKLKIIEDMKSEFAEIQIYLNAMQKVFTQYDFTISRGFDKLLDLRKKEIKRQRKNLQLEGNKAEKQSEKAQIENPYPEIFTDKGYRLFQHLMKHHIIESSKKRDANGFSEIYHYLRSNANKYEYIRCSGTAYLNHIRKLGYRIRKIQPKTNFYYDNVVTYFIKICKNIE